MVIVKSKLTGKFLRQHSGSANNFSRTKRWQVCKDDKFLDTLPAAGDKEWDYSGFYSNKTRTERQKKISREIHNRMYDAEAMEARRYATKGSALSSVGKWRTGLPEHLEIHEIVAGNLCIVDVNDDEETKRRKKEKCK